MSRLRAGLRVGGDFFARSGALDLASREPPAGLVDRLEDLGRAELDLARLAPAVRPFFLAPATLRLRVESRWRGPFVLAWALVRPVLWAIGQLHLPWRRAEVRVRVLPLDRARDGRGDARGVVRSYARGGVMQVMAYATERYEGAGYMSAAFPFPLGVLGGILRLDLLGEGVACGARLTSRARPGVREPVGVWFALLGGRARRMPLEETLDLWSADSPDAPAPLRAGAQRGDTLVGRHEQRLFGALVATHSYWFSPLEALNP